VVVVLNASAECIDVDSYHSGSSHKYFSRVVLTLMAYHSGSSHKYFSRVYCHERPIIVVVVINISAECIDVKDLP
jgi:hypothetical protein